MSKEIRKAGLWGIVIWAICMGGIASGGASFTYEPITETIESASFSVDFAAFTASRTVMGYELNYVKLVDLTGNLGTYDMSDDFFGTAAWPNEPKINMGKLQTGIISTDIDSSFFSALAGGNIGLNFCFTDTGDSMFAMDFISLTLETASETVTSYYGWPVGNENNGFGIGLADGADLPAPLPESIPIGATGTGFDETISSDKKVPPIPVPASLALALLGLGAAWLYRNLNRRRHTSSVIWAVLIVTVFLAQGASAITITDVKIYQMDFYGTAAPRIYDTNWGDFKFTVIPDDDINDYYLNLCIRKNGNDQAHWVIDNMMIPGSSKLDSDFTGARFFSLADFVQSGTPINSVEYKIYLSTRPLESISSGGQWNSVFVEDGLYDTGNGLDEPPAPGRPGPPPVPWPIPVIPEPNLKIKFRSNVRDIQEDDNMCTPTSIARSLLWLHDTNAINLGGKADPNILIADFNEAARWGRHDPNPWPQRLLAGKAKMTKNLKMVNKFMSESVPSDVNTPDGNAIKRGGRPTFEFIRNEIDANEDIEIMVTWLEPNNAPSGGHTMTVIGYGKDANGHNQIWVQDDPHQGQPDPCNDRRNTRYVDGASPDLNDLPKNRVDMIVSESPEPNRDNTHVYPPGGVWSPYVAVGASAPIKAAVQYNFLGVPGADVDFIKRAGSFRFASGFIADDGQRTAATTNDDGLAEIEIVGEAGGPALIEVAVTGVEDSSAFLFFNIISCPLPADLDNDCDVDFEDYAIFANQWSEEDLAKLSAFCAQWLKGK